MVKGTAPPSPPPSEPSPPSPPPSSRPQAARATAVPASTVPCRYLRRLNISFSPSRGVSVLVRSVGGQGRSEEHTSELQSRGHLVCRLLLVKDEHRLLGMPYGAD